MTGLVWFTLGWIVGAAGVGLVIALALATRDRRLGP